MSLPKVSASDSRPVPLWAPLILIVGALALRWFKLTPAGADFLPGFSPWMALAFTGTLLFSRGVKAWMIPMAIILIDQVSFGWDVESLKAAAPTYGCLILAAWWASGLRKETGVVGTMGRTAFCSVAFYVITSSSSWLILPEYSKSLAGWVQALTTGLPGYPASILFLRNALLSDLAFSLVLIVAHNLEAAKRGAFRVPLLRPASAAV